MYRNKLLFVYLCRTFVSNKKKNYEKMRLKDTRNMLVLYSSRCWGADREDLYHRYGIVQ